MEGGVRSSRRKRSARTDIDHVHIDETFTLVGNDGEAVGNGHYISTELNNKRYYGVLISQDSLKNANDLHFQDEGFSLDLNRRMEALRTRHGAKDSNDKIKEEERREFGNGKQVQKFQYVDATKKTLGYRVILATFANVLEASSDNADMLKSIKMACDEGGNWVGKYYYQYEVQPQALKSNSESSEGIGLHTSLSLNSFLYNTQMPNWYPLKNAGGSRSKVLSMLNLKTDKGGGAAKYINATGLNASITTTSREHFRVAILGAGLAGLGCAQELLRKAKSENITIEVDLFEARDRVGGRCHTDRTSFKTPDGKDFPIELGACWIHGVTGNPLAIIAQATGVKMSKASPSVKLLVGKMRDAEEKMDNDVSKLFDQMLDEGAQKCWEKDELHLFDRKQMSTRFYASLLHGGGVDTRKEARYQYQRDVAPHRYSSDTSVSISIEEALKKRSEMAREESTIFEWNIKHAEYSFGANIEDLSMRFWDVDDEYAFKGAHVQLKEGYSNVASSILNKCKESDKFQLHLSCPVKKVEYGKQCFSRADSINDESSIGISDTCQITPVDQSKDSISCDFVVSALPLGVLKSTQETSVAFLPPLPAVKADSIEHVGFGMLNKVYLQFPSSFWRKTGKKEDMKNSPYLADNEVNFGNASGVNPHHYMFFDVGFDLEDPNNKNNPNILHTLISGLDAVKSEKLSDEDVVREVMDTLRHLYSEVTIPPPVAFKMSRWGNDSFSQGAYSFLPPGASDEDYKSLQSAVCADGDFIELGDSKTMRLFFAGEHTSAHYPSLAHGAYISGVSAAHDIFSNMKSKKDADNDVERVVPLIRYRKRHPKAPLVCSLCSRPSSSKEGGLLVFQKDRRFALVHKNCAEYSPDVYYKNGSWRNVIKCVNRGKQLRCVLCKKNGATIGCHEPSCKVNIHFGCCDSGWLFEDMGREYRCLLHRKSIPGKPSAKTIQSASLGKDVQDHPGLTISTSNDEGVRMTHSKDFTVSSSNGSHNIYNVQERNPIEKHISPDEEYRAIPLVQYRFKNPSASVMCGLCGGRGKSDVTGDLVAFDRQNEQALLHTNCLRSSNLLKTLTDTGNYINVIELIDAARTCFGCRNNGASLRCIHKGCFRHYHLKCAISSGYDPSSTEGFFCSEHNKKSSWHGRKKLVLVESKHVVIDNKIIDHNLFYDGAYKEDGQISIKMKKRKHEYAPSNEVTVSSNRKLEAVGPNIQAQGQTQTETRDMSSILNTSGDPVHTPSASTPVTSVINQRLVSSDIACGAAHTAWQIAISEVQRQAFYVDPKWNNDKPSPDDQETKSQGEIIHDSFKVPDPPKDIMNGRHETNGKNREFTLKHVEESNGHDKSSRSGIINETRQKNGVMNANGFQQNAQNFEKEKGSQINPIIVAIDSDDTDDDNPKLNHTGAATDPIPIDDDEDPSVDI